MTPERRAAIRTRAQAWLAQPADMPADQRKCRDISMSPPRRSKEISRQTPRSGAISHTCRGVIHRMENGHRSKVAWRPNRVWSCPACATWLTARDVRHLLAVIGNDRVTVATIAATAWPTRQRRLQRHQFQYATVEQPAGQILVIAQARAGEQATPTDQLEQVLTSALERKPVGAKVRPSTGWTQAAARKVEAAEAVGHPDDRPPASKQWRTTHVITRTPMWQVVQISKRRGLYVGPLGAKYEEHELSGLTSGWVAEVGARRVDRQLGVELEGMAA
jgi:hypothetical protein